MLKLLKLVICTLIFISILPTANGANQLWETKLLWESQESYNDVLSIKTFYNDSLMLYSADGRICIRDVSTGQLVIQSEQYEFGIMGIFINTDVKILAALAYDFNDKDRKITKILRFDLDSLSLIDSLPVDKGALDHNNGCSHLDYALPISKNELMLTFWTIKAGDYPDLETYWSLECMHINPANYSIFSDLENNSFCSSVSVPYSYTGAYYSPDGKYYIYHNYNKVLICKSFPDLHTLWEKYCYSDSWYRVGSISPNSKYMFCIIDEGIGSIIELKTGRELYSFDKFDINSDTLPLYKFQFLTNDSSKLYYRPYGSTMIPGDMYFDIPTKKMVYRNGTNPNGLIQDYNIADNPYLTTRINADNRTSIVAYQLYVPILSDIKSDNVTTKSFYLNGDLLIIKNEFQIQTIEIYSSAGKMVKTFQSLDTEGNQISLDLKELSQGVYFIKTLSKSGIMSYYKLFKD